MSGSNEPTIRIRTRRLPWGVPFLVGILVSLAGVGLIVWPFVAASWLLVIVFGSALIANGLALLVRVRGGAASAVAGSILILGGVLAIVFADVTVSALVGFVGVSLIAAGVLWLIVGVRLTGGRSLTVMLPAVVPVIGGVVTLIWPEFSLAIVAVLGGVLMLLLGVSTIMAALRLRDVPASATTLVIDREIGPTYEP